MGAGDDPVVGAGLASFAREDRSQELAGGEEIVNVLRCGKAALGFVEGNVGNIGLGRGEVDGWLRGGMVAPGAYGVEVGKQGEGETGAESFAVQLVGKAVGEVLKHGE